MTAKITFGRSESWRDRLGKHSVISIRADGLEVGTISGESGTGIPVMTYSVELKIRQAVRVFARLLSPRQRPGRALRWGPSKMHTLKVGDTIWRFDINRRKYAPPPPGKNKIWGSLIYREHFEAFTIYEETRSNWLVQGAGKLSVNKASMRSPKRGPDGGSPFFTTAVMEDKVWLNDHRHKLVVMLQNAPADVCRRVAALLGYNEGAP